jgi:hypothetical protein
MSDDMNLPVGDEFDFSNDGIEAKDVIAVVVGFEVEEKENGTRHVISFGGDDLPFEVKVKEWVKHSNPVAQQIGRANLKKLARGLTGEPRYNPATIIGLKTKARFGEDKQGFAKLSNFRLVEDSANLG